MKAIPIAVLVGGTSSEREVTLASGKQVLKHLPAGYIGKAYDARSGLERLMQDVKRGKVHGVFIALHGGDGENGRFQALFESNHIPYTGSGMLASALAMDKEMAKAMFRDAGIPTAKGISITIDEWKRDPAGVLRTIRRRLHSNIVIKPNASGSSVGVFVNPPLNRWRGSINKSLREDGKSVLVEAFHPGRELAVGVLERKGRAFALPVIEIRTKRAFFDYKAKYHGASEEICPAPVTRHAARVMQSLATKAHTALGCRGYSRTDIIWSKRGPIVLETNTLPGLTTASLLPQEAAAAGINFSELLGHILSSAGL